VTGQEWLTCNCVERLLWAVEGCATERKLRLLSTALCESIRYLLSDKRSRQAVRVARLSVDGWASVEACIAARQEAAEVPHRGPHGAALAADAARLTLGNMGVRNVIALFHLTDAAISAEVGERPSLRKNPGLLQHLRKEAVRENQRTAVQLIRDVFANPVEPVNFEPRWRSLDVLALAEGTYAGPAFERLPILADALEEAGCTSTPLLEHCRGKGKHVRGCWALDLVFNKQVL
jgi:hypothetical protein